MKPAIGNLTLYFLTLCLAFTLGALLNLQAQTGTPPSSDLVACPTRLAEVKAEFEQLQHDCLLCLQFEERWLMEGGPKSP
jgi:hypothetical protein